VNRSLNGLILLNKRNTDLSGCINEKETGKNSVVNKDLTLKAKAKAKDLTIKAKANDLSLIDLKDKFKDCSLLLQLQWRHQDYARGHKN